MTRKTHKHKKGHASPLWSKLKHSKTDELIQLLGDRRADFRRYAAKELHVRGGKKAFDRAKELCKSDKSVLRESGALVLAQLGTPKFPFAKQSEPILAGLALSDPSASVRGEAVAGLGHLARPESFETLQKCIADKSSGVRISVAFALGVQGNKAIEPLIRLTHDKHDEVRSWAAFSLNQIDEGNAKVRACFARLLKDQAEEVRGEAIKALARWKDRRVFGSLKKALNEDEVEFDFIKAAGELGDSRLLPKLLSLAAQWGEKSPKELHEAIRQLQR